MLCRTLGTVVALWANTSTDIAILFTPGNIIKLIVSVRIILLHAKIMSHLKLGGEELEIGKQYPLIGYAPGMYMYLKM